MHLSWHSVQECGQDIQRVWTLREVNTFFQLLANGANICLASVGPDLKSHPARTDSKSCHAILLSPAVQRFSQGSIGRNEET